MSGSGRRGDDRTPAEELLSDIANLFSVYVGKGLEFNSIFQNIDPNLKITNLDDLLDLHFILSGQMLSPEITDRPIGAEIGVRDFLCLLPERLRQLRTTTKPQTRVFNGKVRGHIDWQETIKERYRTGNLDSPLFACQLAEETVAIPENLVLWELLEKIQAAHKEATGILSEAADFEWFSDWSDDSRLLSNLEAARSNMYLSELDSDRTERPDIPDRILREVLTSRTPLYTEAARLLQRYRRLQNHEVDPTEAKKLLSNRLFGPRQTDQLGTDEMPTFFELYWIFKLLESYDAAERNLITKGSSCIATWTEQGATYELYHDWTGGDDLAFGESYRDHEKNSTNTENDRYLSRTGALLEMQHQESAGVFGHEWPQEPARRPDFVLLRRDAGSISHIAIGEVKYTRNSKTAAKGLSELYRYLIFARETVASQPAYFSSGPTHFETPTITGFLCVDDVSTQRPPTGNVSVLRVGDSFIRPF